MPTTVQDLRRFKEEAHRFVMLTCYDFQSAQIFDEAGVPLIFVGDTLGIFVLGYDTTIPVTMEDMIHHCRAVSRGVREGLVVGDLPFGSYEVAVTQGVENAVRLVKEGGVAMVKFEGARPELVEAITAVGIPVIGHLGLTPQSVHATGGYRVQARSEDAVQQLIDDARRLEAAGASAVVLEAVPSDAAKRVTGELEIPTIGIGAGPHCDGQVLVSTEMLGISAGHRPKYAKRYAELRSEIASAVRTFADEVARGDYPDHDHSYDWSIK